ncbi:MAG TPA: hypothetical protein VNZ22_17135, partial [Bacillota bacterium]|nr:hypothetical protein [Bacillota bacterium]
MKPNRPHREPSGLLRALLRGVLMVLLLLACRPVFAQPLPELHTAAEVRRLTTEQAERHYPVRLRGVITFFDQSQFFRFLQDDTAGIYFFLDTTNAAHHALLRAGQQVEIQGQTSKGEYAPIVNAQRIHVLGPGRFLAAKSVTFEQLASGQEDSQFVAVHGLVRSVRFDERTKYFQIDIATGGGRLTAQAASLPLVRGDGLVDSTVTVQGACLTRFNGQRQLFDVRLLVPRPEDFIVEQPAPQDPFGIPTQKISSLLQFNPQGHHGHRAKVGGTVIYRLNEGALYIQDQSEGIYVETQQPGWLRVGDQVEVLGFPARGDYTPMLQDARFRKIGFGPAPEPDRITADEALKGTHDCRLVCLEATVLDRAQHSREQFLVLQAGGSIFRAYLEQPGSAPAFEDLENDSKVAVTGVCRIETGSEWHSGQDWRASSFRLLLRSPADVQVLQAPSWWTLKKLLWMVGMLGVVVLGAFVWVGVLRQRVQQQTRIIGQKL